MNDKKQTDWVMTTHLSGLCALIGVPSLIGPLICWLVKKDEIPEVDVAGKEAINFHLTMLIVAMVSIPLAFVLIGFVTLIASAILSVVFSIVAAVAANEGREYRYPLSWRLLK